MRDCTKSTRWSCSNRRKSPRWSCREVVCRGTKATTLWSHRTVWRPIWMTTRKEQRISQSRGATVSIRMHSIASKSWTRTNTGSKKKNRTRSTTIDARSIWCQLSILSRSSSGNSKLSSMKDMEMTKCSIISDSRICWPSLASWLSGNRELKLLSAKLRRGSYSLICGL